MPKLTKQQYFTVICHLDCVSSLYRVSIKTIVRNNNANRIKVNYCNPSDFSVDIMFVEANVCWSHSFSHPNLIFFIGSSEVKVKQSPRIPPGFENVLMRTTQIAVNFPSKKLTNLVSIILCLIHWFFFL